MVQYGGMRYGWSAVVPQHGPLIERPLDQEMCGVSNGAVNGHCGPSVDIVVVGSKGQTYFSAIADVTVMWR